MGLPSKGWGPWRREFYSLCSAHQEAREGCPRCASGTWANAWASAISRAGYKVTPRFWLLMSNFRGKLKRATLTSNYE
jgi:hypothetical protein